MTRNAKVVWASVLLSGLIALSCAAVFTVRAAQKLRSEMAHREQVNALSLALVDKCLVDSPDGSRSFAGQEVFDALPRDLIVCRVCGKKYSYHPRTSDGQPVKAVRGNSLVYVVKDECVDGSGTRFYIFDNFAAFRLSDSEIDPKTHEWVKMRNYARRNLPSSGASSVVPSAVITPDNTKPKEKQP